MNDNDSTENPFELTDEERAELDEEYEDIRNGDFDLSAPRTDVDAEEIVAELEKQEEAEAVADDEDDEE